MKRVARLLLIGAIAVVASAALAGSAGAASLYKYNIGLYGPNGDNGPNPAGNLYLTGLDPTKNTKLDMRHGASPAFYTLTVASGISGYYFSSITGVVPGDTIEVRQPSGAVSPTETYVIPNVTAMFAVGSKAVSGTVPAGQLLEIDSDSGCLGGGRAQSLGRTNGSFSATLFHPIQPGGWLMTMLYADTGDSLQYFQYAPGEQPCLYVSAEPDEDLPPGATPPVLPYRLYLGHLSQSVSPSVKLSQVRGGVEVFSATSTDDFNAYGNVPARPGDRYDIFRPQGAATPTFSYTVPNVTAKFDPNNDLIAVDGPALARVSAYPCRQYTCPDENGRTKRNTPAGRTLLDFSLGSTSGGPPLDLRATDRIWVSASDVNGTLEYTFLATPGDLVAPTQKLSIASRLKLASLIKALKRGIKVKLTSSEAGPAKLTLTIGRTKIATASAAAKAGTTSVKLLFTKSGKKALSGLKARGRGFSSQKATLRSVVTDSEGNVSVKSKTITIKR